MKWQDLNSMDLQTFSGNEGSGISNDIVQECDQMLIVPQSSTTLGLDSLNVSVAAGKSEQIRTFLHFFTPIYSKYFLLKWKEK